VIWSAISSAAAMIHDHDIPDITAYVIKTIENAKGFTVEYFNVVDDEELMPVSSKAEMKKGKKYFGCVAVNAGRIRLIDNIEIPL
jgi:pantoate--beta-alanine ligase